MQSKQTPEPDAISDLLTRAEAGGPDGALAARRAAMLAETSDPARARRALALAIKLAPHDPAPRLDLIRLQAEAGNLAEAWKEAETVFNSTDNELDRKSVV